MDERRFSGTVLAILVVVVIVGGGVGAGVLYWVTHPAPSGGPPTAQLGNNLTVNYIGMFGGTPQQGRVFDSSFLSVATNNASYPKSLEFQFRGASGYTPLSVTNLGPASGLIGGFWQGLIGLAVNQTRIITIPVGPLGYWPVNASCFVSEPLRYTIPTVRTYTSAAFSSAFPGLVVTSGMTIADPTYGWNDLVLSKNASAVVIQNLPSPGYTSSPFGWPVTVANVSASVITLVNNLTPASAGLVLGTSATGMDCGGTTPKTQFIVSSVNLATGTFTENYNPETVGATLIFTVTIVTLGP